MLEVLIYSLLAGITIFIGGLLGRVMEKYSNRTIEAYILLHWPPKFTGIV